METATETTQTESTDVAQTEQLDAPQTEASTPATDAFDPAKIDPRVKEHFEKEYTSKYADYEPSKKAAQELRMIQNDPRFQRWVMSLNAPPETPKAKEFEITDDQFTAALSDKAQFAKLVQEAARHLLDSQVAPQLQKTEMHFQVEAKKNELSALVQKYPDFKELDRRGLIEPLIRKYPNISFEEAYKIAKFETRTEDVAKAARGQVADRKTATVERNSTPSSKTSRVKVADRLEAMERAAEDFRAGRDPVEYEYD